MLQKTIIRQINQVFNTLVKALEHCPDELFSLGMDGSIGTITMHAAGSLEDMFGNEAFSGKWSKTVANREECINYINDCRNLLMIPFVEKENLLCEDAIPQYFISKLDRVMKLLRHLAHHTGEVNMILKQNGYEPGPFIC